MTECRPWSSPTNTGSSSPVPAPDAVAYVRAALPPAARPRARDRRRRRRAGRGAARRRLRRHRDRPARAATASLPVALLDLDAPPRRSTPRWRWSRCTTSCRSAESLRRLSEVLRHGARLVVDEFDVDALDERAAGLVARPRRRGQGPRRPRGRDARAPVLGRADPRGARAVVRRRRARARRLPVPLARSAGAARRGGAADRRGRAARRSASRFIAIRRC